MGSYDENICPDCIITTSCALHCFLTAQWVANEVFSKKNIGSVSMVKFFVAKVK